MTITTTHPFSPEELMAYCDGEIAGAELQKLESHLAECADCAQQVRDCREVSKRLEQWKAPEFSEPEAEMMAEELRRAAHSSKGMRTPGSRRVAGRGCGWWVMGGAGAVVATLLFLAIVASVARKSSTVSERIESKSSQAGPFDSLSIDGNPRVDEARAPAGNVEGKLATRQAVENYGLSDSLVAGPTESPGPAPLPLPPAPLPPAQTSTGPLIARSANVVIVVKDVRAARPALEAVLGKVHGYAAQINIATPSDSSPSLQATLRVPASNLTGAMADLRELGRVTSESESGEDVTQQHADLNQRLETARVTEESFRSILKLRTGNVSDVLQVEEGIARVRSEIESMEAEQDALSHRVDFASIDLSLSEDYNATLGTGTAPFSVRMHNALVAGYRNAVGTIAGIVFVLIEYGLAIVIWLSILAVPVILLRRRYRRMQAKL